jgi:hypothetical protein
MRLQVRWFVQHLMCVFAGIYKVLAGVFYASSSLCRGAGSCRLTRRVCALENVHIGAVHAA